MTLIEFFSDLKLCLQLKKTFFKQKGPDGKLENLVRPNVSNLKTGNVFLRPHWTFFKLREFFLANKRGLQLRRSVLGLMGPDSYVEIFLRPRRPY